MKSLMLLNPRRRKRKSSRRRTRRNPLVATRRGSKTTYRHVASATKRRSSRRRARRVIVKVRHLRGSKSSAVIYARANPRRRRSHRRGGFRMNPFGGGSGGIAQQLKSSFSKENLTIAAGAVGGTVLTNYLLNMKKSDNTSMLPIPTDANTAKAVKVAYAVGIPLLGAMLTRKASPNLAKGMLLSGLISGITTGIKQYAPAQAATLGLNEYLDYTPTSAVGQLPPGYMAASRFASVSPMNGALDNSSAFPSNAWGE